MKTNKILAAIVIATAGISSSFAATTNETFASLTNGVTFGKGTVYGPSLLVGSFTNNYTFVAPTSQSFSFYASTFQDTSFSATLFPTSLPATAQALTAGGTGTYAWDEKTVTGAFALVAGTQYTLSITGVAAAPTNYWGSISVPTPVASVPEPETYAMLLAGLGVIGAIARRRKAAVAVA
jgi:hypothetical protein